MSGGFTGRVGAADARMLGVLSGFSTTVGAADAHEERWLQGLTTRVGLQLMLMMLGVLGG